MDTLSQLEGKLINHIKYGVGIISKIQKPYIKIQFDNEFRDFRIKDLNSKFFDDLSDLPGIDLIIRNILMDEIEKEKQDNAEREIRKNFKESIDFRSLLPYYLEKIKDERLFDSWVSYMRNGEEELERGKDEDLTTGRLFLKAGDKFCNGNIFRR